MCRQSALQCKQGLPTAFIKNRLKSAWFFRLMLAVDTIKTLNSLSQNAH